MSTVDGLALHSTVLAHPGRWLWKRAKGYLLALGISVVGFMTVVGCTAFVAEHWPPWLYPIMLGPVFAALTVWLQELFWRRRIRHNQQQHSRD